MVHFFKLSFKLILTLSLIKLTQIDQFQRFQVRKCSVADGFNEVVKQKKSGEMFEELETFSFDGF